MCDYVQMAYVRCVFFGSADLRSVCAWYIEV